MLCQASFGFVLIPNFFSFFGLSSFHSVYNADYIWQQLIKFVMNHNCMNIKTWIGQIRGFQLCYFNLQLPAHLKISRAQAWYVCHFSFFHLCEYWEENVPPCLPSLKFYVCEDVVSNSGGGKLGFSRDWGLLPFIHSSQNTNISTMKLYPLLVLQRERSQISYSQIGMWNIFINKYLKVYFVCF